MKVLCNRLGSAFLALLMVITMPMTSRASELGTADEAVTEIEATEVTEATEATEVTELTELTEATELPENGEELAAEEVAGFIATFVQDAGATVTVYATKDLDAAGSTTDLSAIVARNGDTGEVDISGDGQINFSVEVSEGYTLESVDVVEGTGNYKNVKLISEDGNYYVYRITKVNGPITISVSVKVEEVIEDETEAVKAEIDNIISSIPAYYDKYFTSETVVVLENALSNYNSIDKESASMDVLSFHRDSLRDAVNGLTYKTSIVPQVFISTDEGNGNTIVKRTGYVGTSIAIVDTDGSVLSGPGTIKVRGNSTSMAPKKPFNIKFNTKEDVLGMGAAKKWCLLANCFDPTLVRNAVAFNIAHELDIPYTSEYRYVELWVDGIYKGSYQLFEAVEQGKTRVNIDLKKGDFLIQYERDRFEEGVTYVTTEKGLRFSVDEPEEPTEEQLNNINTVLGNITEALDSGDFGRVSELIDIDSFAKFYILNEYMRNYDFDFSSVYFFCKDGKLYAGPAWDYDISSGNSDRAARANAQYASASAANFYPYLMKYGSFMNAVKDIYEEHSDYLNNITAEGGMIDSIIAAYGEVFARNFNEAGWDISVQHMSEMKTPFATYEENVEYFRNWLITRKSWMDGYVAKFMPHIWVKSVTAEDNCITLAWLPEEGAESYFVFRRTEDSQWVKVASKLTQTTFSDYSAEAQVQYYYDVVSYKNGRYGSLDSEGYSAVLEEKNPKELKIEAPLSDVTVSEKGTTAAVILNATGDGLTYTWYRKDPKAQNYIRTDCTSNKYELILTMENSGTLVYCIVKDVYGNKAVSNAISLSVVHEVKEEIIPDEDGNMYYYRDGVKTNAGLILLNGYYYFINNKGMVITGSYYVAKTNGLMPAGRYMFASDGRMITTGIFEEDGVLYYYENGKKVNAGLIFLDGYYYFINNKGMVVTGPYYVAKTNGLMPAGKYLFAEDGKMITTGIYKEDGVMYYYENGKKTNAGLIYFNGNYYFINNKGMVVTGSYYVAKTNGLMPAGRYFFDEEGRMVMP